MEPLDKISLSKATTVDCPSCGEDIDVEQVLGKQAEERLRSEFNNKFRAIKKRLEDEQTALERERLEVKQLSAQTWEIIQAKLKEERIKLAEDLQREAELKSKDALQALEADLRKQEEENLVLRRKEIEVLNRERQILAEKEKLKLSLERAFIEKQANAEKEFRTQFYSREEMLKQEYEKKINDQRKLIEEMNRKIEQGSMQMQGEVQEMAIEQHLKSRFVFDQIEAIKTGARGADCLQHVRNQSGESCGTIYIESKRTKSFQPAWIEKFKADMRRHTADIGILVTQTMPSDLPSMGQRAGIWICTYEELKVLAPILRDGLISIQQVRTFQEQSGDKVKVLYNYLTSNEFRMQIEGIVEGFTQMQDELHREKRAMESIWKRREKQIEKVVLNTNHMYSSIRGIAGSEVQKVDALELPEASSE
ncbi:MAG: DUF2130 domain-containing protein [Saprospiraceae bacterium]|nr:DUF2130 domain-containing protein [Saprospiraceae bacterium]